MSLLEQFAVAHLGRVDVLGAPGSSSALSTLHVRDNRGREWFVKQAPSATVWSREQAAHRSWERHPRVPQLRASDEVHRLILVRGCPGSRPRHFGPRVMRGAGRTLRRLHEAPVTGGWSSTWREQLVARVEVGLERMRELQVPVDDGFVRHLVEVAVATELPEVLTHGDFVPNNWRWSVERGLHTFDFGEAGLRPAAFDHSRVRHAFLDRPRALGHFTAGYGRALDQEEERLVAALLPWRGMVSVDLGSRIGADRLVRRGLRTLRRTTPATTA